RRRGAGQHPPLTGDRSTDTDAQRLRRHFADNPAHAPRPAPGEPGTGRGRAGGRAQAGVLPALASTVKRSARWAMRDFLFAAWFLWMTPLLTALSSRRAASRCRVVATSVSPASTASR